MLATAAAALIAIVPLAAAVFVSLTAGPARTAFATASAGDYAVVVRPDAEVDVVVAVPAAGGAPAEIARIDRLPGYTSYGAVSPDGTRVALVTADGGRQSRPVAALLVVELDTATVVRLAKEVDYLQTPLWAPDSASVTVTRTAGEDTPAAEVSLLRVPVDGGSEQVIAQVVGVLGAYPVGFDRQGRLVHVAIGQRGSVAYRDGTEVVVLADGITRDWRLSPDGRAIAFIETTTANGVHYYPRTAALDGGSSQAMALTTDAESLGVAWRPGSD
jgi:dipeptidyl aminopeptidase/acylaminoacyl peptidase